MPDPSPSELSSVIEAGLPSTGARKRVIVVGAGMAGLVAATELLRAGHDVTVLEGRERVGGRVHTLREPFTHGLFAEAGAMRIPRCHDLTMAYVEKFGLATVPFTVSNPEAYFHVHGRRFRMRDADANPGDLDFDMAEAERATPIGALWMNALAPFAGRIEEDGPAAWDAIAQTHDQYSTREFLDLCGWSEAAIELFGLMLGQEALMNSSFMELLREEVGNYYTDMVTIAGGMDLLPRAFLPQVAPHIRFGAKLVALDQSPDGVTVHYATGAGRQSVSGDYAVVTVPFPVLRHVEMLKPLSKGKQRAIRQLHYDASAKILLQFRRRFWEEDEGIFGGGTFTDLPIRVVYYPEQGRETGRGVVLASYTWAEDAQRWGSLPPHERLTQALENLACIHPQASAEFEVGASKMWHDDEFAGGAFALFDPGQQTQLHRHIIEPEGRIHFAGEHASLAHAWIQGAIESGLRAAIEVHQAP
ncbi:MAG: flavin monoamine oxidase family protein [Dehalococcoidia bacterium]